MNLAKNLEMSALYFPDRPAISEESSETTYAQLNAKANRVATALLGMGIRTGDHVGLCAPNSGNWLAFYFGVLKAGAVAVTLSSQLKKNELQLLINHSRPKMLFTFEDKLDDLWPLRNAECLQKIISPKGDMTFDHLLEAGSENFRAMDRERSNTAAILYTGGTTGTPKGVMLSHENINASIHTVIWHERSNEKDRALCFLPFNHVFGQMHIMNGTILSGGCLELMPSFDLERVLASMEAGRVPKFYAVPTIYVRLLNLADLKQKIGDVRYCFSAAASMAAEVVHQWKDRTNLAIHEGYGMTEAAPTVAFNHHIRHVIGSVGTEVPGVEIQIRDQYGAQVEQGQEGEICVRGPNIMKGYLANPEATRKAFWENGWFRTGDVGLLDEDGYLYIVDRLKDMIITGGENVYSLEVEDVLYKHPDIQECAIIGVQDREWGESVTAYIIPQPGTSIDKMEVKAFLKSHLSAYKVPKAFHVVDDFPRSPAGKILKRKLRNHIKKS
jgi:long-chain acyl-CoA synthetase